MRGYFALYNDIEDKQVRDRVIDEFFSIELDMDPFTPDEWTEELRWDDFEGELKSFSKFYPTVVFTLDMEDQNGDRYRDYYLNGKVQNTEGRLVFDDFNEYLLE